MTILYADDDFDDRMLFQEAFSKINPAVSCITVCDGKELFQRLSNAPELPDAIFLDVNMPIMDGRECLIELKRDRRLKSIPVVIYSTTSNKEEIQTFLKMGAMAFIQKALTYPQLYADLVRIVRSLHSR